MLQGGPLRRASRGARPSASRAHGGAGTAGPPSGDSGRSQGLREGRPRHAALLPPRPLLPPSPRPPRPSASPPRPSPPALAPPPPASPAPEERAAEGTGRLLPPGRRGVRCGPSPEPGASLPRPARRTPAWTRARPAPTPAPSPSPRPCPARPAEPGPSTGGPARSGAVRAGSGEAGSGVAGSADSALQRRLPSRGPRTGRGPCVARGPDPARSLGPGGAAATPGIRGSRV